VSGSWDRVEAGIRNGLGRVFPAAVLLVNWHGTPVFHRAYGHLDPDTCHRLTHTDTLFDLASLTKLFTATAFMTLVGAGRAELDCPVVEILPEFSGSRPIGPAEDPLNGDIIPTLEAYTGILVDAATVTFRHLLTHTSGLAAWRSLFRDLEGIPPAARRQRAVELISGYDFAHLPGDRVVYSDLGFILLGEAVARLTGQPLDQAVRSLVLDPLGLAHTAYCPLHPQSIAPTEMCAWRGRRLRGEVDDENAAAMGGVSGHAGLFSTAWEVAILGRLYLDGGRYGDVRLLSPELAAEMVREQAAGEGHRRGLAWMLATDVDASCGPAFSRQSYGHTGFTGTSLWIDPTRELIVVLLTNRVYHGRDGTNIATFRRFLHENVIAVLQDQE